MQPLILILGGYGNFGKRIAHALVKDGYPVIIAGRNPEKARNLVADLEPIARYVIFDANKDLVENLKELQPKLLINTCGPYQTTDYRIADACIDYGIHYIDLADGRDFVMGIRTRNKAALKADVSVISGASTVPGLSSAVLDIYQHEFLEIDELIFGISPGQRAERGLATTKGILTYVGKRLNPFAGHLKAYGWQGLYRQHYPELGWRWMANCDIPDLDLLPERYKIGSIRFSAGLELPLIHLGLWGLSWLVRLGIPLNLPNYAPQLLTAANWFDRFGTADGGMHLILRGKDRSHNLKEVTWHIIAKNGSGPHIPTIPAIVLAKKIVDDKYTTTGAYPCVGLVELNEYLHELRDYPIDTHVQIIPALTARDTEQRPENRY